ncbi:unnamed protein product [marine sediment metagenome]|uniref:Solute-binding protein family 5 domain-containing protein n=1 Tax=marine sediment metagenome TaxID=412755 RepID=X0YK76_9ZZZZ
MKLLWRILLTITVLLCSMMIVLSVYAGSEKVLTQEFVFPAYVDPVLGYDHVCRNVIVNIYDPLVFPSNKGEPQPCVAKSWDISPDGLTYTFFLQEGIKFHDGTELTAEDVKFSLDRTQTMGSGVAFMFTEVKNVEVIDKYTVVFHLKNPVGAFISILMNLFILNKDLVMANIDKESKEYGDLGDYGGKFLLHYDAGSGPYILKDINIGEFVNMLKNQNYWKKINADAPDVVRFQHISPEVALKTLMARREVDICDPDVSLETLNELDKIEGVDLLDFPLQMEMIFQINTQKPPTDDIHFRKAMAWAFDYSVINEIYPRCPQAAGPAAHEVPGFDPTVFQYHRDLDRAKEELKQSKYYEKLDQYPVNVQYGVNLPRFNKLALLLMSNMKDIGIIIKLEPLPWMTQIENYSKLETSPNVNLGWFSTDYPEVGSIFDSLYASKSENTFNIHYLRNPEIDTMIADAFSTINREERFKKYSKILHSIVDLCPDIYLFDYYQTNAYASGYIYLPQSEGKGIPLSGYKFYLPNIKVYPEKKEELRR